MRLDTLEPITREGLAITSLFWVVLALSAAVLLVVLVPLGFALLRFRARKGEPDPPQVEGNRRLEIVWTSGALALVGVLFAGAVLTMRSVTASEPPAVRVTVIGHQWWWEFQYPDLGVTTANELHLPIGAASQLDITSADVIHSFWVPQLGWKQDGNPGQTHSMWVRLEQPATVEGACAEYCGTQHAWMRTLVVAEPPEQFEAWVRQQQQPAGAPSSPLASQGQQIFQGSTCANCHTVQGTSANGTVGPSLTHFGSRSKLGAGVLDNTPANVQRWILNPRGVKPGVLMPSFNNLSPADAEALAAYLEGLE